MNINWDAQNYSKDFKFVHKYGEDVIELLQSPKGSRILDLGCGNGKLTIKLKEKGYNVTGIDDSEAMLNIARANYNNIEFKKDNVLTFKYEAFDGIFSNAVLHWIDKEKQSDLLKNIASNIKTGGEFVCEFGGIGCAETVHSTLRRIFNEKGFDYKFNFYFPTIGEYAPLVENAGFSLRYAVLFDRPTVQQGENGLENWIRMFNLLPFNGFSDNLTKEIINKACDELKPILYKDGKWFVDYVRIRLRAVKLSN